MSAEPRSLRVALADDEAMARKRLSRLVESLKDAELVGAFESATELLEALPGLQADVVLLDIQMPELTGLDAAALLAQEGGPYVIFVTAHSEHALTAFEHGALDYVLKPVDVARLAQALARARRMLPRSHDAEPELPPRLAIQTMKGIVLVDPQQISHAVYDGQLVTLCAAGRNIVTDWSLSELETRVPGGLLLRVHRRYLLNLAEVERLEPVEDGGYNAVTRAGAVVPVARQAARVLRKRLGL
jgi:two-component system LytT family response regulator